VEGTVLKPSKKEFGKGLSVGRDEVWGEGEGTGDGGEYHADSKTEKTWLYNNKRSSDRLQPGENPKEVGNRSWCTHKSAQPAVWSWQEKKKVGGVESFGGRGTKHTFFPSPGTWANKTPKKGDKGRKKSRGFRDRIKQRGTEFKKPRTKAGEKEYGHRVGDKGREAGRGSNKRIKRRQLKQGKTTPREHSLQRNPKEVTMR